MFETTQRQSSTADFVGGNTGQAPDNPSVNSLEQKLRAAFRQPVLFLISTSALGRANTGTLE
jgi:hypothetical protein